MSWGVSAFGRPESVAKKLDAEINQCLTYLTNEEKEICAAIGQAIQKACAGSENTVIKISASGHASTYTNNGKTTRQQSVTLSIENLTGFCE